MAGRGLSSDLLRLSGRMSQVALGQGGVITAAQCHELGASGSDIRVLLRTPGWERVRRGVYADLLHPPVVRPHGRDHVHAGAAALAALRGEGAVLSHLSAARLLGLPVPPDPDPRVMLTRPPSSRANHLPGVVVHVAQFDPGDVVEVAGVPVLAGARLLLDCCEVIEPDSALAIADAMLRRGDVGQEALARAAACLRGRPRAAVSRLVAARADPLSESWFESMSRWWLLEAGLPRPLLQLPFLDTRGRVRARVDMFVEEFRTVGEADGTGKYLDRSSLVQEKEREDWLRHDHRVEVVRWVPSEMRTPRLRNAVVRRFLQAFHRSRW